MADPWVRNNGRPPTGPRTRPVELRRCRRHGEVRHGFYRDRGGPRWRCLRCVSEAVTRRHHKIRRILVAEAGGRCALCGYDRCIINLHFHHVDPATKSFALTSARGKGLAARREEARKCVLVCANCHGEIEAGLIGSPPPGARYGEKWEKAPPLVHRRGQVERPPPASDELTLWRSEPEGVLPEPDA